MTQRTALDQLFGTFEVLARQIARTRGLDAAEVEDVVQDVRIRLWKAHPSGENAGTFTTSYLVKVVTSAIVDHLRRKRRHTHDVLDTGDESMRVPEVLQVAPEDTAEREALAVRLRTALDSMTPNRRMLVLLHLEGYTRDDMVNMTGWTEAKVRNLLYRGLDDLRERLERSEAD